MFKHLRIGETFRFASEFTMPNSGMKTGLCVKISARKYRYIEDAVKCEVGSVTADVTRATQ